MTASLTELPLSDWPGDPRVTRYRPRLQSPGVSVFTVRTREVQLLPAVLSLGWIFLQGFGLLFLIRSSVERVPDTVPTLGERVQLFSVSAR